MKQKFIFLALFITLFVSQTFAQSSWDLYQPRTLKEIITTIAAKSLKNPDVHIRDEKKDISIILSYNSFQSRVKATYTGSSRKVSDKRKEFISIWLKTLDKPKEYLDLFENEYLFIEDKVEYWLPVQKQVASFFSEELKKGDTVTLFVVWLGARKDKNSIDYIFLMNEFEAEENS
ncbi:MAG TPA: hypothetical protein VK892_08015 [Pyrinomonadaceae bacterium]|nr:hypothetical protein [Pyrinomonadaceae bacterium]